MDAHLSNLIRQYKQVPSLQLADQIVAALERSKGPPTDDFTVQAEVTAPESRVKDLLVSAFEGGSNYWYQIVDFQFAPGYDYQDFQEGGRMTDPDNYYHPAQLIPFAPGCGLWIVDINEGEDSERWLLDRAAMQRGLALMAQNHPHHFADFMEENDDANTGDVFLQLSLFGELVFG